ncbi:DNA-binding protein [bacterium]|nr:DNA-binding protein [bacterium]PJA74008.1 MAG: DNA-binding protein [bacterium CG_4_9_14_3_um_filter_65_15]
MSRTVIGVMGGSSADAHTLAGARELGRLIAERGWVLLSGGRPTGVMQASVSGAHEAGGLTVGVLFDDDRAQAAAGLDIVIPTGFGAGRNVINILASDVVVACRGNGGTLSEIALALRFGRPLVLLDFDPGRDFLDACSVEGSESQWAIAPDAASAVAQVSIYLAAMGR